MTLRVATVDSQNTFDSIEHDSVWESLKEQSVSEPYVKLWKKTYDRQTRMVMIDVESDQFEIERRTRREKRLGIALVEDETHCMTDLRIADDVMLLMMMTAHRPASDPNDPRKRNDKHSIHKSVSELTPDSQTRPLISSSSFLLLQFSPPCFGFFFLHVSLPFSCSFHHLFQYASSSHRLFCSSI